MSLNSSSLPRPTRQSLRAARPLSSRALFASTMVHTLFICVLLPPLPVHDLSLAAAGERVSQRRRASESTWIVPAVVPEPLPVWEEAGWIVELLPEPEELGAVEEIFTSDPLDSEQELWEAPEPDSFRDTVAMQDPLDGLEMYSPIQRVQPIEYRDGPPDATPISVEAKSSVASPDKDPVLIEARSPAYPRLARRAHWEGVALCRITVSAEGAVTSVSIERSSGHEILDEAALEALRDWRFEPGLRNSVAAEVALLHSVRFQLQAQ